MVQSSGIQGSCPGCRGSVPLEVRLCFVGGVGVRGLRCNC